MSFINLEWIVFMKIQRTNYNSFLSFITAFIKEAFIGPWKIRSLGLISLLIGYSLASAIPNLFLVVYPQRVVVVFVLIIMLELAVRIRKFLYSSNNNIILIIIDNLRIGISYAIVLEAFKLGS